MSDKLTAEDLTAANSEFLVRRGWRTWSRDERFDKRVLLLCPLCDYENVPDGTVMTSITGEQLVKGQDKIDTDVRGGLIAFGVLLDYINIPDKKKTWRTIDGDSPLSETIS